jgi:hypothetical protein
MEAEEYLHRLGIRTIGELIEKGVSTSLGWLVRSWGGDVQAEIINNMLAIVGPPGRLRKDKAI